MIAACSMVMMMMVRMSTPGPAQTAAVCDGAACPPPAQPSPAQTSPARQHRLGKFGGFAERRTICISLAVHDMGMMAPPYTSGEFIQPVHIPICLIYLL